MGFWKNLGNRLGNTVGLAPRAFGTGLYSVSDATQTALYGVLDPVEGIGKTASSIKEAVYKAFTQGKWYQKLWKAPASLAATPFMLIEGAGETLWHTGCNLFRNVRDTLANPFLNIGHSIKRMGTSRSVGDFRFDNINNMRNVTPEMKLASVFA